MRKKNTILCVCIFTFIFPAISFAAGYSSIKTIGFSNDGRYFAYETTFYDDMEGSGYRKIICVDVAANHFVKTIVIWDGNEKTWNTEYPNIQNQVNQMLDRYKITFGNTGKPVYQDNTFLNPLNYQKPDSKKKITRNIKFSHPSGKKKNMDYQLILQEFQVKQSNCSQLAQNHTHPKILALAVINQESIKILQKDKRLFPSRQCPYAYGIYQVYIHRDKIAVFLDSWTMGSEGHNIHKLIVTGTLP